MANHLEGSGESSRISSCSSRPIFSYFYLLAIDLSTLAALGSGSYLVSSMSACQRRKTAHNRNKLPTGHVPVQRPFERNFRFLLFREIAMPR